MLNKGTKLDNMAVDLVDYMNKLRIFSLSKINPDWLDIPTYSIRRHSQFDDDEIIEDCGKGPTECQARASAIFESAERYSGETFKDKNLVKGTYSELKEKHDLMTITYLARGERRQKAESTVLGWSEGYDLLNDNSVLVPLDCIKFPYLSAFYTPSTTGLAAGKTMKDAVLHGIFEVIEHDTLSIYTNNSMPGKEIALDQAEDEHILDVYNKITAAGIKMTVKYLPNDTHIPVVLALFDHIPQMPGVKSAGVGCHLDPYVATMRALTEAAQSANFWDLNLKRVDEQFTEEKRDIKRPPLYFKSSQGPAKRPLRVRLEDIDNRSESSVTGNTKKVLDGMKTSSSRVIALDITSESIGIPAVKILIPDFEDTIIDGLVRGRSEAAGRDFQAYTNGPD
jgi:ribosomal protein S12 methylthiotransferase accessory factor